MSLVTLTPSLHTGRAETAASGGEIVVMTLTGVINPISEGYLSRVVKEAGDRNARLLLVEIDTPGGLMESMWVMIQQIVNSKIPVAVYVTPQGAHAASAGTFILMAAHIAAMAPSTTIGAAHPVGFSSDEREKKDKDEKGDKSEKDTMMQKVVNDAVTRMKQNAQRYGRNAVWAEKAIRDSVTIGTDDAVKQSVVDLKAESRAKLLELLEGRTVTMADGRKIELKLKDAAIVSMPMTAREEILHTVSHPSICYLRGALGVTAIGIELYSPGLILPGVVGVLSMALAFMGLRTLPINYVGLALIFFSFLFFILELKLATSGLLTLAGILSLIMGSVLLIDSPLPSLQISRAAIGGVVGAISLVFLFIFGKIVQDLSRPPATGLSTMVGLEGQVSEDFDQEGLVKVAGEFWKAHVHGGGGLLEGDRVRVVEADQKFLTVEKIGREPPQA